MKRRGENSGEGVELFGVTITNNASTGSFVYNTGNFAYNTQADQLFEGYLSDGFEHNLSPSPPRKRGLPWTEEEHRSFLAGLEKLGKGDWRGISMSFVTTRTATQVASHAQKYFLRQKHVTTRDERRSSLFDICHYKYNNNHHKGGNSSVIMPRPKHSPAFWPLKSLRSSIDLSLAKYTVGGIAEKGCGLSLSIAPPSRD